jgi:Icc-related predicted phosphoesterase
MKQKKSQECGEVEMKIAICSDLHLEFSKLSLENPGDVDVLILSGDICVIRDLMEHDPYGIVDFGKSSRYHTFFQECSARFPHVIYIVGNHEHYHGDFKYTISDVKKRLEYLTNLHILDKETYIVDDVTFIGGTLWTDMNKEDPLTLHMITRMMNDFRCVDNSNREVTYKTFDDPDNPDKPTFRTRVARFSPQDAVDDHKEMLEFIKTVVAEKHDKKFVVVGHHTPSHASCHPKYKDDREMNGGYHSDLSEFILDRPQIKLWTHGHTHELFDYMIGETRVVCNPRGYHGYEEIADNFKLKVVEV